MRNFSLLFLAINIIGLFLSVDAQKTTKTFTYPTPTPKNLSQSVQAPGNIQLLPDYVHIRKQGIDTAVGEISKSGGLVIRYDIGFLAGNYSAMLRNQNKENISLFKVQNLNGLTLYLSRIKNGKTAATFSETCANFIVEAPSEEDYTDFLLMIMTYRQTFDPEKLPLHNGRRRGC